MLRTPANKAGKSPKEKDNERAGPSQAKPPTKQNNPLHRTMEEPNPELDKGRTGPSPSSPSKIETSKVRKSIERIELEAEVHAETMRPRKPRTAAAMKPATAVKETDSSPPVKKDKSPQQLSTPLKAVPRTTTKGTTTTRHRSALPTPSPLKKPHEYETVHEELGVLEQKFHVHLHKFNNLSNKTKEAIKAVFERVIHIAREKPVVARRNMWEVEQGKDKTEGTNEKGEEEKKNEEKKTGLMIELIEKMTDYSRQMEQNKAEMDRLRQEVSKSEKERKEREGIQGNIGTEEGRQMLKMLEELHKLARRTTPSAAPEPAPAPETENKNINRKTDKGTGRDEAKEVGRKIDELKQIIKEQSCKIDKSGEEYKGLKEKIVTYLEEAPRHLTYASAAAAPPIAPVPVERESALHSIIIESKNEAATSEEVMEEVRGAVKATDGWVTVERVRKTKDRKVILGCRTVEERERVKERLQTASDRLKFEEMKNHDPMVILREVIAIHSDKEIIAALRKQNGSVFHGLEKGDDRMEVKFRRKARNSLMSHVVLRVSPRIYNRMLDGRTLLIDMQRVKVADQSPLIQCSVCLAYGHGRRLCTETVQKCTHCGGPHTRNKCADYLAAEPPKCVNCTAAKLDSTEHNAYSPECAMRRKWEALARAKVQYRC